MVTAYPAGVKEFVVYTALRLLLFAAAFAIVFGGWALLSSSVNVTWALIIAFVLSGIGSFVLLNPQREAFARRVEARAERATSRFDEMRAKEDDDRTEDDHRTTGGDVGNDAR